MLFLFLLIFSLFFIFLVTLHSLWDLGPLNRDWTQALSTETTESEPLDCQGIPSMLFLNNSFVQIHFLYHKFT